MTSLHAIVPSRIGNGHIDLSSLSGALGINGAAFANILAGLSPGTDATAQAGQTDPLAQLTALIQNGTPLSKIADQLAQTVGNALQQRLSGKLSQAELDGLRSSITQSIANALAPPGNAPPGTPRQQAAALAQRLRGLIESLARDTAQSTGQLNDIAGQILDAKSAKEIPAQARGKNTPSTLDVSSLVSSLLSGAVIALQSGHGSAPSGPSGRYQRILPTENPPTIVASAAAQSPSSPSLAPAANDGAPVSNTNPQSPTFALPSQITIQNAPDVLARMLVRAAGTDAKINGVSALGSNASPASPTAQTPGLAARLEALLASAASNAVTAASSGTSSANTQNGGSFDQQLGQQPSLPSHDSSSANSALGVASAPVSPSFQAIAQNAQAPAAPVDTTAVIEQLVKGLTMRTNAQGDSEIRLHLQPENLGDVTMKITVSGSQISANVVASSAEVRNALVSNHHQLARSLADAGLTLSGFSVDVSGGNAGRDRQNNDRTAGFGRRYTVHELPGVNATETPALANLGPPLLSGSNLALFNYLA